MKRNKKQLVGRDHTKGLLSFKTGVAKSEKVKLNDRKSKLAQRELRKQLEG